MKIHLGATLSQLRKNKKLTQKALAAKLSTYGFEVKDKTIYNWEKELSQPSIPNFIALCDILDVDDVLWQFAGIPKGPYAGLNKSGRQKAREFIDLLFHVGAYKVITGKGDLGVRGADSFDDTPMSETYQNSNNSNRFGQSREPLSDLHRDPTRNPANESPREVPRILRLYDIPVSAGTGNFLDSSSYEEIEAPSYVPIAVDFALRVSGDSMEPLLQDGQVIWVKEQEVLDSGEIGIFTYSDDVYCKKLIADGTRAYLRSLNPIYSDIEILDDFGFRVIGKVV
ncbi:MAG: XRE family transcriptional regulator [Oscillospiraceae bacterium]|nr:XRE family transcriptional regulator [Oscillospiraceae bacterium]